MAVVLENMIGNMSDDSILSDEDSDEDYTSRRSRRSRFTVDEESDLELEYEPPLMPPDWVSNRRVRMNYLDEPRATGLYIFDEASELCPYKRIGTVPYVPGEDRRDSLGPLPPPNDYTMPVTLWGSDFHHVQHVQESMLEVTSDNTDLRSALATATAELTALRERFNEEHVQAVQVPTVVVAQLDDGVARIERMCAAHRVNLQSMQAIYNRSLNKHQRVIQGYNAEAQRQIDRVAEKCRVVEYLKLENTTLRETLRSEAAALKDTICASSIVTARNKRAIIRKEEDNTSLTRQLQQSAKQLRDLEKEKHGLKNINTGLRSTLTHLRRQIKHFDLEKEDFKQANKVLSKMNKRSFRRIQLLERTKTTTTSHKKARNGPRMKG
jgi:hypothetical protein